VPRRWLILVSVLAVGALCAFFAVLTAMVWHAPGLVDLDLAAQRWRSSEEVDALLADGGALGFRSGLRPQQVVDLGSRRFVIPAAFLLALLALVGRDRIAALVAVGGPGLTGGLTQYLLKPVVNVPDGPRAFPSGHAGGITAVALVAVVLVYRRWGWLPALLVAPLAAAPALLVGAAVLRLNFHYPTDVLGGSLLAATIVLGLTAVLTLYRGPGDQLLRSSHRPGQAHDPATDPSLEVTRSGRSERLLVSIPPIRVSP
jgi:membrane-associated phospholipid phosphatase